MIREIRTRKEKAKEKEKAEGEGKESEKSTQSPRFAVPKSNVNEEEIAQAQCEIRLSVPDGGVWLMRKFDWLGVLLSFDRGVYQGSDFC
jgi:hypothetical protein